MGRAAGGADGIYKLGINYIDMMDGVLPSDSYSFMCWGRAKDKYTRFAALTSELAPRAARPLQFPLGLLRAGHNDLVAVRVLQLATSLAGGRPGAPHACSSLLSSSVG